MDSTRQLKISKLILRELSTVFQKNGSWIYGSKNLVSVTDVRISPDLSVARIQISIFPSEDRKRVIEQIETANQRVRYELAALVKNQLRKVPELHFYVDDTFDKIERIDQLLKK